jgi:hypothetical protein
MLRFLSIPERKRRLPVCVLVSGHSTRGLLMPLLAKDRRLYHWRPLTIQLALVAVRSLSDAMPATTEEAAAGKAAAYAFVDGFSSWPLVESTMNRNDRASARQICSSP